MKPTSACIDNLDGIERLIAIKVDESRMSIVSELTVLKGKLASLEENRLHYLLLRKQVEAIHSSFLEMSQSLGSIADTRTKSLSEFEILNKKLKQLESLYDQQNSKGTKNHSVSKKGFGQL